MPPEDAEAKARGSAGRQPARRRRPSKKVIAWLVTIGVLVVVFAGVFPRFAHYSQAWSAIRRIPTGYLLALVAATVAHLGVNAWQVQAALPGLRYRHAFVVDQTSFAVSNAVPAGGPVSFGLEYEMLESYGFSNAQAAGASAISIVFNFLVSLAMPVLGVLALLAAGQVTWHYLLIALIGIAVVGGTLFAMAAVLRSEEGARRVGRVADRYGNALARRFLRGRTFDISNRVLDFRSDVVDVMKTRWLAVTVATLLTQITSWLILYIALRGLEHGGHGHSSSVSWAESLAAFSFAMILWSVPITAGGLGTVDATLTGLLSAFGARGSEAVAVDIVWRAATFISQVVIGALTFLYWRATADRRRRAVAEHSRQPPGDRAR